MTHLVKCYESISDPDKPGKSKWIKVTQSDKFETVEEANKHFAQLVSVSFDCVHALKIVQYYGKQIFKIFQIN